MRCLTAILISCLILSCNSITERIPHFAVHGIDVSHYQAHINWDIIADQKIDFAFVKATEGAEHIDSLFTNNWTEIKRVGMKRGAYHFFRPTISAKKQAQNFINNVDLEAGDLPPVLDVEVDDGISEKQLREGVALWLKLVEEHYKVRPIVYTNLKFFDRYINNHFDNYPFWIARYNTLKPYLGKGKYWQFWQYGNRGQLDGINGFVDFNVFRGTMMELESFCINYDPIYSSR